VPDRPLDTTLLLRFDTDDPLFARGFECGRLWAILRDDPEAEVSEYVRAGNLEMLLRLAEATGRAVQTEDADDAWVLATFTASVPVESDP
jgi:hypothetical protein